MKTIRFLAILSGILLSVITARAQSFTYTVENSKTTITGFSAEPSGAVVVPATLGGYTVTEIGRSAFKDRAGITAISFASGAGVTKLGTAAFQGCTALQTLSLPSGTALLPAGLAQGCTNLTSVTIPGTVTGIGAMAFADCEKLGSLTLPSSLTSIGESALANCRILSSLAIPSGVTVIPAQLVNECRALSSISFAGNITSIGNNAFHNCEALTSFSLPNTVTSIGSGAFSGCSGLATINLGTGLATIGDQAFQGCSGLAAINVTAGNTTFSSVGGVLFNAAKTTLVLCPPVRSGTYAIPSGVTALAEGAFAHCGGLTSVTLPPGLPSIANDAFYYATGLSAPPLTASVTTIGSWAFAGLKQLTELTIPATISSLGSDAFHSTSSLKWVIFSGNAPSPMGDEVFDAAADDFTVYFYSSASGFTAPAWMGYPAVALDIAPGIVSWLAENGYAPGTDLLSDPDHDGVNLLMACALGLDPGLNLAGSLPVPVLANGVLSLTFQGNTDGILYSAETSTDLQTWSATGVTLSSPDANGKRTASVNATGGHPVFLRILVQTAE